MSLHNGFTISQSDFTITSQHLFQFTVGSELVFHLTVVSPNTKYSQSVQNMFSSHHCRHLTGLTLIHQFTNSPIHHGFTLTCTRGPRCFPSDRPSVNPLWGGHGLNELSLKASRSTNSFPSYQQVPVETHTDAYKLTIHPSGSIFPVFIAPTLFALWDHA